MSDEPILEPTPIPLEDVGPVDLHDRITVQCSAHFEQVGEAPTSVHCAYSALLPQAGEQVYIRRAKVGEEWVPLDMGWLPACSMVIVENLSGMNLQRVPSVEEQRVIESQILLLHMARPNETLEDVRALGVSVGWEIPPSRFHMGMPRAPLFLRCTQGQAPVRLTLFPRKA